MDVIGLAASDPATVHTNFSARTTEIAGWGRFPTARGEERRSEDLFRLTVGASLTRGAGRAYGDAALPAPMDRRVANSTLANRILDFDPNTGVVTAEAGFTLDDLYRVFLPRGFFTPVTPGTRFVTLGGMIASDVHGKNHHQDGTIGQHVESLVVRVGTGEVVSCSRSLNPDLFRATLGGMGLTGHILEAALRLARVPSPWIVAEQERIPDLATFISTLDGDGRCWPMTAGWIDCLSRGDALGRGILYRGRWATREEARNSFPALSRPLSVPVRYASALLRPVTMRAFNAVNYWKSFPKVSRRVVHPAGFFYPLDSLADWNLLYGAKGFIQYQCVLPKEAGADAPVTFLRLLTNRGGASFLCVIKDCGPEGIGLLSFPRPGVSMALDIPMSDSVQSLVDALNELVIEAGGRIYLAKDALTRPEHFRRMEPRLDAFLRVRREWDPNGTIRTAQSVRLFGW